MKERELVNCSCCGSEDYAHYPVDLNPWLPQDYTYSKCRACGFVYVNPRPTVEEVEEIYTAHTNPFDQEEYEGMEVERPTLERMVRRLKKVQPQGRLLDVGSGRGDFLKIAHDHGYEVQGSDLSTAESPYPEVPIFQGFLKDANFKSKSFDIIVTRNTLEHIFDPNEDLQEINRLLKPGGLLYVKVPHRKYEEGWRCRAFFGFKSLYTPPVHLNHFDTFTLKRILQRNGFEFVSWESEKPSKSANKVKNMILSAGYGAIDIAKRVSFGHAFPKPVLCVLVRKVREAHLNVAVESILEPTQQPAKTQRQRIEDPQTV